MQWKRRDFLIAGSAAATRHGRHPAAARRRPVASFQIGASTDA